jgi:hypothetical protein
MHSPHAIELSVEQHLQCDYGDCPAILEPYFEDNCAAMKGMTLAGSREAKILLSGVNRMRGSKFNSQRKPLRIHIRGNDVSRSRDHGAAALATGRKIPNRSIL